MLAQHNFPQLMLGSHCMVDWNNVSKVPWLKETTTGATSHYTAFVSFV